MEEDLVDSVFDKIGLLLKRGTVLILLNPEDLGESRIFCDFSINLLTDLFNSTFFSSFGSKFFRNCFKFELSSIKCIFYLLLILVVDFGDYPPELQFNGGLKNFIDYIFVEDSLDKIG